MFGFLKNLLQRPADTAVQDVPRPTVAQTARPGRRPVAPPVAHEVREGVDVPLHAIVKTLPPNLLSRLVQPDVGELAVSIPLDKILAQLNRGVVRIQFGDLRRFAPGLFAPGNDQDQALVTLPLAEILCRLDPALLHRRRTQRQVPLPPDTLNPFGAFGQGLSLSAEPLRPTQAAPAPARQLTPTPMAPSPLRRSQISPSLPAPEPPAALPVAPPPALERPKIPAPHAPPPPAIHPAPQPASTSTPAPLRFNIRPPEPVAEPAPEPAVVLPEVAQAPALAAPKAAPEPDPLLVTIDSVSASWPDAVRQEMRQLNMADAKVALPSHLVEQGLRLGRIAVSWKTIRSWAQPPVAQTVSPHDQAILDLPLKTIAPVFLARARANGHARQKISVDQAIPNLFFGAGAAEPAPTAPAASGAEAAIAAAPVSGASAKSADTNFYSWDEGSGKARSQEGGKSDPSLGTSFVTRYATPNEIVSRAAAVDGVVGALIALPDGLMVASRLSPEINGDTLAAFLPQIFGKVSQCTKELRMGELNNLHFTVGNVPWKIFRVNAIFFAAFGRPGEPLPTAQLSALAAELDRKPK